MNKTTTLATNNRLKSIDALRGFVMLIMLIDHVRSTFYGNQIVGNPFEITKDTDAFLFFTRGITHLCAPIFVLLTGISAFLYFQKTQSIEQTRKFLLYRGLFLVVLEILLINHAWVGDFPHKYFLQVIWAIGICMICLSFLIGLNRKVLLFLSLAIIFGHNLLDNIHFENPFLQGVWNVIDHYGWIHLGGDYQARTTYPFLAWLGIILLGFCLGTLFGKEYTAESRRKKLLGFATLSLVIFFSLRLWNHYGEQPWEPQSSLLLQTMSFFNFTKYPPSLLFILWNLGIGMYLLVLFEKLTNTRFEKILCIYGSVPMFFYVLHLYLLKGIYALCVLIFGNNLGSSFGFEHLSSVWIASLALNTICFPFVLWFSKIKHQNKHIVVLKYF